MTGPNLDVLAAAPHAATYAAAEQTGSMGDRAYRLVVYRSSSLDRRKAKTLERELAQARATAERAATALTAQAFACAAAAFRVQAPRWPCTTTVTTGTVTDKRARPGRDDPAPTHPVSRVQVTWGPRDDAAVQTELARRSTFVLITTLPPDRHDAAAWLWECKGQTSVEPRVHFLKDPACVDAVLLRKPERTRALGYVMLRALPLFSFLERRVRHAATLFPTAYRGVVARPTGPLILRHCRGIQVRCGTGTVAIGRCPRRTARRWR